MENQTKHILQFTKASGAGNDFVIVDNMTGSLHADYSRLAVALCSRHFGIGADGLLVIEPSPRADFSMLYYNADGSYGAMCGNGGRCAARFAFLHNLAGTHLTFEALDHIYRAETVANGVKLHMKEPRDLQTNITLHLANSAYEATAINTGTPHAVIFVEDLKNLDVENLGRAIRFSKEFAPEGTNPNFVQRLDGNEIKLRTYERGVEAETLACGTGSVAAAIVSHIRFGIQSPVTVNVQSGEELRVHFKTSGDNFTDVILEGSAHILFEGKVIYDETSRRLGQ